MDTGVTTARDPVREVVAAVAALTAAVAAVVAAIAILVAFAVAAIAIAGRLSKVASIGKSSKAAVPLAVVVAEGCRPSLSSAVSRCRPPAVVVNGGVTAPPASSWVVISGGVTASRHQEIAAWPSNAGNGALTDRWNRLSLENGVSLPNDLDVRFSTVALLSAGHSAAAAQLSASA